MVIRASVGMTVLLVVGCATHRPEIEKSLDRGRSHAPVGYLIGCPDELLVRLGAHAGEQMVTVSPDGRINLGPLGQPRVEGLTTTDARSRLATLAGLSPEDVSVRVLTYRSRQVYVFGSIDGGRRAVSYEGPESVVQFLRRCGGLEPGADLREVHVVRSQVATGQRPEVYHIDLAAILVRKDSRTDLTLLPGDEVYVGATKRASLTKAIAPWLQPIYKSICGLWPWGSASTNAVVESSAS